MNYFVLPVVAAAVLLIGFERGISVAVSFAASLAIFYCFCSIFVSHGKELVIRVIIIVIAASVLLYMTQFTVLAISMISGTVLLAILRIANMFQRD